MKLTILYQCFLFFPKSRKIVFLSKKLIKIEYKFKAVLTFSKTLLYNLKPFTGPQFHPQSHSSPTKNCSK